MGQAIYFGENKICRVKLLLIAKSIKKQNKLNLKNFIYSLRGLRTSFSFCNNLVY